jgi:hypothetical protein
MNNAEILTEALKKRFDVTIVQQDVRPNQVRLLCRVPAGQSQNWVILRDRMLSAGESAPWTYDGSRVDMRHPSGSLVWGWRLIFQHPSINDYLGDIASVVLECPRARFEVMEQQLPTRGRRPMMSSSGKGAAPAGTTPLLVRNRSGGIR